MTAHTLEPAARKHAGLVAADGRTYPLRSAHVVARAEGGIALTTLTQVYDNPYDEALEVIYTLALPADGAVLGYVIRLGDKVIRGEIETREQAADDYRRALYEGRTAGLLEQDRADAFQQRLGNLPPHTRAEVEIEVLQPLAFLVAAKDRGPQWEYRFPTVAGVRYEGAPGRVPDAGRLDVDRDAGGGIPTRVEFALTVAGPPERGSTAVSPSHAIEIAADPAGAAIRFRQGERLDRDIAVQWAACESGVDASLVQGRGLAGDDGCYGLITLVPPATPAFTFHRDLTLLIDASGSMHGFPLEAAREVAAALLDSLEPGDRFEILAFANEARRLTRGLEDASVAALDHAREALTRLTAGGGTEMLKGIEESLQAPPDDTQRQVVLFTDGYIGFENEIVGYIARELPAGCRLHAVGVGHAPNWTLIHGAARAGRGAEFVVSGVSDARRAAERLLAATARPVLTDLVVAGSALRALAPCRPGDVYAGRPLVLTAELEPGGGVLELQGRLAGVTEPWRRRLEVPAVGAAGLVTTPLPIGALHGREAIADLEQELAAGGDANALNARIESRGMRHGITSIRTSLVAISAEPAVDPKQPRRRERLAVELPAGVSAEGAGLWAAGAPFLMGAPLMERDTAVSAMRSLLSPGRFELARKALGMTILPAATIIHRDGDLMVVEFQVPTDGFELPTGKILVHIGDERAREAEVDTAHGSPRGPHRAGVLVLLALRFDRANQWRPGHGLSFKWKHQSGLFRRSDEFVLPVRTEIADQP